MREQTLRIAHLEDSSMRHQRGTAVANARAVPFVLGIRYREATRFQNRTRM